MEIVVTYCRACGGEDRPHSVVMCHYVTNCETLRCRECGTEKTVPRKTPEVPEMIDRAKLVRVFEWRAHLHASCADDYLHNDSPIYRELYPGFRQKMCEGHIKTGRKFLELAEEIKTGEIDSYWAGEGVDAPTPVETLEELKQRGSECLEMFHT